MTELLDGFLSALPSLRQVGFFVGGAVTLVSLALGIFAFVASIVFIVQKIVAWWE